MQTRALHQRATLAVLVTVLALAPLHAFAGGPARTVLVAQRRAEGPLSVLSPEEAILQPSSATASFAGTAVAVEGAELLVGVPGNAGSGNGNVTAYRFMGGMWNLVEEIEHPDLGTPPPLGTAAAGANFGAALATEGDLVVVGAPFEGGAPETILDRGGAFVFQRSGGALMLLRRLNATGVQRFGTAVAISPERRIAVGAPRTDTATVAGAVLVYEADSADGMAVPVPTQVGATDLFGAAVALAGDTLVVGAPRNDVDGTDRGRVYAYARSGGSWMEAEVLSPGEVDAAFVGTSVALSADGLLLAVGAPGAGPSASASQGAVYVYRRATPTGRWGMPTTLTAEDARAGDRFGSRVALDTTGVVTRLLVGAPNRAGPAMQAGGGYLFEDRAGSFVATARFQVADAPSISALARMGSAAAIAGDTVVLGAPEHSMDRGLAVVFRVPGGTGAMCTVDGRCESGTCVDGANVCCESECDDPCQSCNATGMCVPATGTSCMLGTCMGTCNAGMCEASGCDAGIPPDDAPPFDAGPRPVVRVSGCKCHVGRASSGAGALALLGVLGLILVRRFAVRSGVRWGGPIRLCRAGGGSASDLPDRRRPRASVALVLLAVGAALGPSVAEAQEAAAEAVEPSEYDTTIGQALREYDAHNYEESYALFTRAHELRPSARTQRALGKAAFELRRYIESVRWLEASLTDERSPLTPDMRAEVETILARARSFIGTYTVTSATPGAELLVDTLPLTGDLALGIDIQLDLGPHELTVRATGYVPDTRRVVVRGTERETIAIVLEEATPDTIIIGGGDHTIRDLGYGGLIAGGAMLVVGIVGIAVWSDSVNTLNSNIAGGACDADPVTENVIPLPGAERPGPICLDLESRYRLALPFAYAGFIGGAVFLGAGLGMVLGAPSGPAEDPGAATLSCGPFGELGVSCSGTF